MKKNYTIFVEEISQISFTNTTVKWQFPPNLSMFQNIHYFDKSCPVTSLIGLCPSHPTPTLSISLIPSLKGYYWFLLSVHFYVWWLECIIISIHKKGEKVNHWSWKQCCLQRPQLLCLLRLLRSHTRILSPAKSRFHCLFSDKDSCFFSTLNTAAKFTIWGFKYTYPAFRV